MLPRPKFYDRNRVRSTSAARRPVLRYMGDASIPDLRRGGVGGSRLARGVADRPGA